MKRIENKTQRTLVLSDVHGMYLSLVSLLKTVRYSPAEDELICLGDYIDRGPDSRRVVEFFQKLKKDNGERVKLLKGNHEDICVKAHNGGSINGVKAKIMWSYNGGDATLKSWGGTMPANVLRFIETLPLYHESNETIFVHGGVKPGLTLDKTDPYDLLWCRDPKPHFSGKLVVVGHSIQPDGVTFDAKANTLLVDTGACGVVFGVPGRLSLVDMTNNQVHYLRTNTGRIGHCKLIMRNTKLIKKGGNS